MLDNLRDQASFGEEKEPPNQKKIREPRQRRQYRSFDEITHMTARQRFALAVMLLIIVTLLGTMLLVITGKIVPSFMY
ncbi:MAG: hypothetical protein ACXWNC_09905 [Anaerolineales bacterium]